jgi:hypothetical protein
LGGRPRLFGAGNVLQPVRQGGGRRRRSGSLSLLWRRGRRLRSLAGGEQRLHLDLLRHALFPEEVVRAQLLRGQQFLEPGI